MSLEIAHLGADGVMHGHSLIVEAWTASAVDLIEWRDLLADRTKHISGQLERTIGGRTFEDVAAEVARVVPEAARIKVRLPTLGAGVEFEP